MAEPNCYAYPPASYTRHTSPGAHGNSTSYLPIPDYRHRDSTTDGYHNGPGFSGSREMNDLSPGPYSRGNTIDEWAELQRKVEFEAAILKREGPGCLRWPEYQFQDSTPLSPQESDLSPYDTSPPPSTESPDSVLSQDGFVIISNTTDSNHTSPPKRFKCTHPDCSYAADRQDHVNDHYRAHHLGIYYECDKCPKKYVYKGDFASHSPCNSKGRDVDIQCEICGATLNKKGLNRHQKTEKCKFHHMTHAIAC